MVGPFEATDPFYLYYLAQFAEQEIIPDYFLEAKSGYLEESKSF